MKKIIQLTDLHIVPHGERVFGFDPVARLQAVLDDVYEKHADADLCVITGDLTDRGDEASYQLLRDRLQDFPLPLCLMMGNHDRRQPFLSVFPDTRTDRDGFVQSAWSLGELRIVVLDTLDEALAGAGRLCPQRLAWLSDTLADAPDAPTIVFLHHPPFAIGVNYFANMLLANGGELDAVLNLHPQVVHLGFGHVHMSVYGSRSCRSFSAARGSAPPIEFSQQQLDGYYQQRLPSYDVILFEHQAVTVHHVQVCAGEQYVARETVEPDGSQGEITLYRLA